jgi:Rieske Fe-S protein
MTGTAHTAGGVAAAAFTLPALAFALGPVFQSHRASWLAVGPVADFPIDTYLPKVITLDPTTGTVGKTTVYMRQRNPSIDTDRPDQYNQIIAVSNRCMHLGCPVRYIDAAQRFVCPCHGGVYDFRGVRTGGPPVRPLDRFYTRIIDGIVQIGPRYSVNSELRRFSPRDPGEPIDGIGQYLYPSRPTIRKLPGT